MTADQYRLEAQRFVDQAHAASVPGIRDHLVACAQVYALLAISAQAAENREDVPF